MRRLVSAMLAAIALVISLAAAQESKHPSSEPTGFSSVASSDTFINLLRESHDIAQQFPVSARITLLSLQTQMVSQLRADLAREWANELLTLSLRAKGDQREFGQSRAMSILARVDPDRALEMLHRLSPEEPDGKITTPQLELAINVFGTLVARDGANALPVLEQEASLMGAQGPYPYAALGYAAMQATEKDWGRDNQHAIQVLQSVFEPAFARYSQNAHGFLDDLEFGKMLQVLAGGLPFESVQPALRLLVKNLLAADVREYAFKAEIFTRDGESAKTNNAIDAAILFFGMLINRDPELAQQLETTRPELRTALEYAKDGRQAKMEFREMQFAGRRRLQNLAPPDPDEDVRLDALRLANINAEAAIAKAEQLPDDKRASTMLWVARNIAGNHPERAAELVAEIQRGNKTNDDETQLDLISAQVFVAAGQHKKDDLNRLLQRGFDAANRLVVQPQVTNGNRPVPGLGPMVQIGIQNNPELTISFIEGLPASYLKADLLLGAASALHMHMSLPLSSQPHQRAEKPDQ